MNHDFKKTPGMIYYCDCTGLWGVLPCEEQDRSGHMAITVTDHDACRWLNAISDAHAKIVARGPKSAVATLAAAMPQHDPEF